VVIGLNAMTAPPPLLTWLGGYTVQAGAKGYC
jgi:hypothetical protein